MTHFAIVTRDEILPDESRLIHGIATERDGAIEARDDCDGELLALCDAELARVRAAVASIREGSVRIVVSARREQRTSVSAVIGISLHGCSIATTPQHLSADYEQLREIASVRWTTGASPVDAPVAWRNGSAAVLLHEAAGHAAEHGHRPIEWPRWLTATDESESGTADLLAGEAPRAMRRESFTDVPLRRMTNVVVGNRGADIDLPPRRVDILLAAGGRYEPLTETITIRIAAADLVDANRAERLAPFTIAVTRAELSRALRGASGPTRRYPGVICSREGQHVFVSSYAPDIVTEL